MHEDVDQLNDVTDVVVIDFRCVKSLCSEIASDIEQHLVNAMLRFGIKPVAAVDQGS